MWAMCRAKFKWSKLSAAIYGINKLCLPCVPAYNEIHKYIGGEVYIPLIACNDIHGAIALYSVSKFRTFEFHPTRYEYACLHALFSPFWGRVYKPLKTPWVHLWSTKLKLMRSLSEEKKRGTMEEGNGDGRETQKGSSATWNAHDANATAYSAYPPSSSSSYDLDYHNINYDNTFY